MDTLAGVAGVPKSVLYNHFADRDGLMAAVADAVVDEWAGRREIAPTTGAGPAVGRAAVEDFVVFAETEPQLYDLVRSGGAPPAVSRRIRRIGAGIISAEAPAGADPNPVLAAAVGGALFAAVDQWLRSGRTDRDTLVDELLTFLRDGLRHLPPA